LLAAQSSTSCSQCWYRRAAFSLPGKFDQYKRDIPYSTLAQAFQSLIRPLLGKSEAELAPWRDALRDALGPNAGLIVDLVPEVSSSWESRRRSLSFRHRTRSGVSS
jgi:predicted ATPase